MNWTAIFGTLDRDCQVDVRYLPRPFTAIEVTLMQIASFAA